MKKCILELRLHCPHQRSGGAPSTEKFPSRSDLLQIEQAIICCYIGTSAAVALKNNILTVLHVASDIVKCKTSNIHITRMLVLPIGVLTLRGALFFLSLPR